MQRCGINQIDTKFIFEWGLKFILHPLSGFTAITDVDSKSCVGRFIRMSIKAFFHAVFSMPAGIELLTPGFPGRCSATSFSVPVTSLTKILNPVLERYASGKARNRTLVLSA